MSWADERFAQAEIPPVALLSNFQCIYLYQNLVVILGVSAIWP